MSDDSEIMRSLGRIEQKIDGHTLWMTAHVADDKKMADDITLLKLAHSRQRGFITAIVTIGGVISGIIGYVIEYFASGRGQH